MAKPPPKRGESIRFASNWLFSSLQLTLDAVWRSWPRFSPFDVINICSSTYADHRSAHLLKHYSFFRSLELQECCSRSNEGRIENWPGNQRETHYGASGCRIVALTSERKLLVTRIENQNNQFTKVTMYSKLSFELTAKEDWIRTCYTPVWLM